MEGVHPDPSPAPAVARALQMLARVARLRRLYHPNNELLVRANGELETAFNAMLAAVPLVTIKVRPDAFVFEELRVFEEPDAEDPIPLMYYREGIRRLEFSNGLSMKELDVLLTATSNSFSFSGFGDDLVSYLWRHDLQHVRYLVVDDNIVDASEHQPGDSETFNLQEQINLVLRSIYGDAQSDVGPRSLHVDQTDFTAKEIAERLTAVDEMAPGFHPARALLQPPAYAEDIRREVEVENEARLSLRALHCAIDALSEEQIEPIDRDTILDTLLRMLDGALLTGELTHAARIVRTARSLQRLPHLAERITRWLAEALTEARLRPLIIAKSAGIAPEPLAELSDFFRGLGRGAVPALIGSLAGVPDPARRHALADLALEIGIDDIEPVMALLRSGQSYVEQDGLYLLTKLKGGAALELGMKLIQDPDPATQASGFQLLGVSADPKAEALIFDRVQRVDFDQQELPIKRALLDAYAQIAQNRATGFLVRKITKASSEHLPTELVDGAVLATEALRLIKAGSTLSAIQKAETMHNKRVREAARHARRVLERGERPDAGHAEGDVRHEMGRSTGDLVHAALGGKGFARDSRGPAAPVVKSELTTGQQPAAPNRSQVSPKVLELGRSFLSSLFMGVRTAQIHDPANRAFENALNLVREGADALFAATNGFSIQIVEDSAFLNGALLRFEGKTFEGLRTLKNLLETHGFGGIQMRAAPTYEGLRRLLLLFASQTSNEQLTKEELQSFNIELLGVQRFKDEAEQELKVDRRAFAVQCYAKLLLSLREQRDRLASRSSKAEDPEEKGKQRRPRMRSVRVIQDVIELCGDRLDLILRLGSNHDGAPLEELHSTNVCILSLAMGHVLGLSRQDLVDLGVAVLFHDLGRTSASREEFATEAFAGLLSAGGTQASTLLRALIAGELSVEPGSVSKFGVSRPPRHPYTRLVEVAKAYDALGSGLGTPDGSPLHPLDALAALIGSSSATIDPRFGDLLVNVLRAFPRGTKVRLDSGEVARVKTQLGSSRWDRPVIDIEGPHPRTLDLMSRAGGRFVARIIETIPPGHEAFSRPSLEAWRGPITEPVFPGAMDVTPDLITTRVQPPTPDLISAQARAAAAEVEPVPLPLDALQPLESDQWNVPVLDARELTPPPLPDDALQPILSEPPPPFPTREHPVRVPPVPAPVTASSAVPPATTPGPRRPPQMALPPMPPPTTAELDQLRSVQSLFQPAGVRAPVVNVPPQAPPRSPPQPPRPAPTAARGSALGVEPDAEPTAVSSAPRAAPSLAIPRALSSRMRLSLDDATLRVAEPRRGSSGTGQAAPAPAAPERAVSTPPVAAAAPIQARSDARPPVATYDLIETTAEAKGLAPAWTEPSEWGYEAIAELGRTDDSAIFSALERRTGRRVRLKVFDPGRIFDARLPVAYWIWLGEREATLAKRIDHPFLPRLLGAEKVGDAFAIAYEEVGSVSLRECLRGTTRPNIARLFAALADTAQDLHGRGFVHCNLTLDNIRLRPDGTPYLPDLSLAMPVEGPTHPLLITHAACLSPELASEGRHDASSDQFVLGAAMYEVLSGRPPFGGDEHTLERVIHQPTPALAATVPAPLAQVVLRMLDKDPARRYGSCAEVAWALRAMPAHAAALR